MRTRTLLTATCLAILASAGAFAAPAKTIADLRAAYKGETTAASKYAVYAAKAQKEGYPQTASLFRAAARAEQIHARNHKQVLASLGVPNPQAGAFTAKPGATSANLKDAIKGESYERDTMYPAMLKNAAAERQPKATRTLKLAQAAERQHAALYSAALKSLDKKYPATAFQVCPVCGATYVGRAPAECPQCATPRSKFFSIT